MYRRVGILEQNSATIVSHFVWFTGFREDSCPSTSQNSKCSLQDNLHWPLNSTNFQETTSNIWSWHTRQVKSRVLELAMLFSTVNQKLNTSMGRQSTKGYAVFITVLAEDAEKHRLKCRVENVLGTMSSSHDSGPNNTICTKTGDKQCHIKSACRLHHGVQKPKITQIYCI